MQKKFCLVIPCFEEAKRLAARPWPIRGDTIYVFVDDGSQDKTLATLKRIARPEDAILPLRINGGKAAAVRLGMLHALTLPSASNSPWIGFWDADLATPLEELDGFGAMADARPEASAIWGSRVYRRGAKIERKFLRHLLGRLFATAAKLTLGIDTYDSQCGAKIFRRESVAAVFEKPFLSRWLFDVEIYCRLEQLKLPMVEQPLNAWKDVPGGKLNVWKTAFRTLFDLAKIRAHYGRQS